MKSILFVLLLSVAVPGLVHAGETEELQAKLEAVKARRQALVSDFQAATLAAENARLKDIGLAGEEKVITDKLAALEQKDKAAAQPGEQKKETKK